LWQKVDGLAFTHAPPDPFSGHECTGTQQLAGVKQTILRASQYKQKQPPAHAQLAPAAIYFIAIST
jgi:hypothetical protein